MSGHVFVVSEWLPKKGCEEKWWKHCKEVMALSKEREEGCVRAHATRQIAHPGSPTQSKFSIVLLQEYVSIEAFDAHCAADYVKNVFEKYVGDKKSALVEEWRCRLFSE
ncbi:MAG: antibiotic biosynthesis monooxygenase [Simkaniaceae bacterium]|nr:antibiotic biosynthesis monooxygenase [Simkaniaceae bacterium]